MKNLFKRLSAPYRINFGGWSTDRKIIVFESDDWGSIRMPSSQVYKKLLFAGYRVDEFDYERYDSLASENDLTNLFELLMSVDDHTGRHPVFTANSVVANPDFDKIRDSGFSKYYFEPFTETLKKYPAHKNSFNIWQDGMKSGVFYPQFHAREHLNVSQFMMDLQKKNEDLHFFFDHHFAGTVPKQGEYGENYYVEALKIYGKKDKESKLRILIDGLTLFEQLFGYKSQSLTPPNYIWYPEYNSELSANGVDYYQGRRKMRTMGPQKKESLIHHKLGEVNQFGQLYLIRNVFFEPTKRKRGGLKEVEEALRYISVAFKMGKPAVISTHRLNYIGYIDPSNSSRNLKLLKILLVEILKKWPDSEFKNSIELGKIIRGEI